MQINLILITQLILLICLRTGDYIIFQIGHYIVQDIILFILSKGSFTTIYVYNILSLALIH